MPPTRNSQRRARRCPLLSSLPAIVAILLSTGAITILSAFVPTDVSTNRQSTFYQPPIDIFIDNSPRKISSELRIGNNDNADLLEKARRLREEASLMEDDLKAATNATPPTFSADVPVAIVNTQLEESIWTLTYRFSSQPPPKDGDNSNNNNEPTRQTIFYSGKTNLLLKEDGYSEQIIAKGNETKEKDIEIVKIWGWDRETSAEDDLDYLLFSMDVKFPESDPELSNQKERYYFQARIEQETDTTSIALKDGTITVKKDVTEKTGGMWGLFNVAGILTEFRYCGDFAARASL